MIYHKDKRLKPCAFCRMVRSPAVKSFASLERLEYRVICRNCGVYTARYDKEQDAIDRWNKIHDEVWQKRLSKERRG